MRLALLLVVLGTVTLTLTMTSRQASAQLDVSRGSVGVVGQVAQNTGETGDAYRLAYLLGVNAGYEVVRLNKFTIGALWSWGLGEYRFAADELADDRVRLLEMSLGFRGRRLLGRKTPRFLSVGAGVTMLRLNRALPPDDKRLYLGPYATIGLDQFVINRLMLSFAVRYGLVVNGPSSLGVRFGVSWGS